MKILFHLGHPAHFHLFKNTIHSLSNNGHKIYILIKKKDILEELLRESGLDYINILPEGRKDSKFGIAVGQLKQTAKLLKYCLKHRPDVLIGSTPSVAQVGRLINKPSISLSEDDASEVSLFAKTTYPFTTVILSPDSCNNGKWNKKTVNYNSYHELAYLHPNHFIPNKSIVEKYLPKDENYFLIRFSSLNAYHDAGISGINTKIAKKIVEQLQPHGKVLITSERKLSSDLEKFRINVNPKDIHHFLAFAKLYIGDSQTMAAEAGVLGTPFIRVNDFVGRLGYLEELEKKYELGWGIKPMKINTIYENIQFILDMPDSENEWQRKKEIMLNDKIDFSQFLTNYIVSNNYNV